MTYLMKWILAFSLIILGVMAANCRDLLTFLSYEWQQWIITKLWGLWKKEKSSRQRRSNRS